MTFHQSLPCSKSCTVGTSWKSLPCSLSPVFQCNCNYPSLLIQLRSRYSAPYPYYLPWAWLTYKWWWVHVISLMPVWGSFCRTCFSMGDLGVQVSVCLFVRPSVCPSVNIYHGCLVSVTPLTVFYWSFWNFADVFFMVWGCACGLDIIVG